MYIQVKCPKCKTTYTAIITQHLGRKVVFDACTKCGIKLTNEQEEDLEITN